jgi:hypothetical protein
LAGALALSGPQSRLSASVMKKMTRDVMRCAEQITAGLTGDPAHFKRELKRAARISGC